MTISNLNSNKLLNKIVFPTPSISATTGTPVTGNYTDASGFIWDYWTWDGNGSVTISQEGYAKVLICGGGARGDGVNIGSGATAFECFVYLPLGTHNLTIGGGAGSTNASGGGTTLGSLLRAPGGRITGGGSGNGQGAFTASTNGTSTTYGTASGSPSQRGDGGASAAVGGRIIIAIRR